MTRLTPFRLFLIAAIAAAAGCSGGGSSTGSLTGGQFVVLSTEPSNNATLFLNDSIHIDFSNPVDGSSVDLNNFSFQVLNQIGNVVAEPVAGTFAIGTSPGDSQPGRRLSFVPRLPTNDSFTNGGFRPGRTYRVQLVGGNRINGTVLRDIGGRPLSQPRSFQFSTADGTAPSQLFRNTAPGGPRRTGFEISPLPDAGGVVLNKLGAPPLELRLSFDQPLNPSSTNVPVALNLDPLVRNPSNRGRIYLAYDDPEFGENIWIPARVELEVNATSGAVVVLRPLGVLPNNAVVRVVVERVLEDISGESNVANVAYDPVFATFQTRRAYEQQFDGLVDEFLSSSRIDFAAAFGEPLAQVGPGYIKASFAFEGSLTGADFEPAVPETILNTDFTQITPANGAPFNVSGGVFNFRNVRIPTGRIVRGQGSNPMVWLVSGTFEVAGTLSVRGGDGTRVFSSSNASVPKAGGAGVCGGGNGGAGSPSATKRDASGGTGNGPLQQAGLGGAGGVLSCVPGCNRGAGGGGGSFVTQGDPNYKVKTAAAGSIPNPINVYPIFQQQTGVGGNGCIGDAGTVTRSLQGAVPGALVFSDARNDNNFWGVGIRFDTRLRIAGELSVPVGGGGGGGGGDLSYNSSNPTAGCNEDEVNFENDSSGGGGGGGGGVLIVKCLGPIIITDTGRITADGGHGGGGEQSASCNRGGGGGGGAGGMVVLMSATRIEINARGSGGQFLYAAPENNYDFSISADGGVCVTGTAAPVVAGKYPAGNGAINPNFRNLYDSAPLGGFGGMGIVQLMVPPGTNNADNTNTVLDDNIRVFRAGIEQNGQGKRQILAWRGFQNNFGQGVDDNGNVIDIGDNEGDIRPSPILLPVPFSSKSRLRSIWIDTGSTSRRGIAFDDNLPRGIVEQGGAQRGPRYEFAGLNPDPASLSYGYAKFEVQFGRAVVPYTEVVPPTPILLADPAFTYLGQPAYRIRLSSAALGPIPDRFSQYEAELLDAAGSPLADPTSGSPLDNPYQYRILAHSAEELILAIDESPPLPAAGVRLRVLAKFFEIRTNDRRGQGDANQLYVGAGGAIVPRSNVRIGFAFHQNPASATALRFPPQAGTFTYDLHNPAVQEQIRQLGATFVQWDILFDTAFRSQAGDPLPQLVPGIALPEVRYLNLPFRF